MRKLLGVLLFISGVIIHWNKIHADGLPGEYLINQWWKGLSGTHSPLTNPAFMMQENYFSLRANKTFLLGGEFGLIEAGFIAPILLYQSFGITYCGQEEETIRQTAWSDLENLAFDTLTPADYSNNHVILSYAINPLGKLSVGANLTIAQQKLFTSENKLGFGIDAGITYRLLLHPKLGIHIFGAGIQNLIPPTIDGQAYAQNFRASWAAILFDEFLEAQLDVSVPDFMLGKNEKTKDTELMWQTDLLTRVRFLNYFSFSTIVGADMDSKPKYAGVAPGFDLYFLNGGRDLELMYQVVNTFDSDFDVSFLSHSIYVRGDFGVPREEQFARNMARKMHYAPNRLYNRARKLYEEGNYWNAYFLFSQLLVEYPNFARSDLVHYLRNSSLENLDMRTAALKGYLETARDYGGTDVEQYTRLGLMRIYYRNDDFEKVGTQFTRLNQTGVSDSVLMHGHYLMGETALKSLQYKKALEHFSEVTPTHPDYPFAIHSSAIAYLKQNDEDEAIVQLNKLVDYEPKTNAQEEIKNRSYAWLGLLFYEQNALAKAVYALRQVPDKSMYSEDALLGLGWCALRSKQMDDCIEVGRKLRKKTKQDILVCEASLIESYAYMMKNDYAHAVALLSKASERLGKLELATDPQVLNDRTEEYTMDVNDYQALAKAATDISLSRQSETVVHIIDSLHSRQKKIKNDLDKFHDFMYEFHRATIFSSNLANLEKDIDFALATAQNLMYKYKQEKDLIKAQEEEGKLEDEIEKLQKELEELEEEEEE